ncbi:tetrapyrrole-binding protein, chloroplastic-like [Salvia miltiorrhiza]|uniref:tetrapyrrole-binding protein, chloroplastic-like n=1 Tax=Salvia miltiorrhiza TaxID=226208 RepID=UPI0025ACAC4A|nr:tetrapyrrole-binding protein, chloroplastic-like [Salvia miltiorrhiza]
MSTNTFNSIHQHYHRSLRRRHSIDCPPTTFSLRPRTTTTTSPTTATSLSTSFAATSAATSTPTTNPSTSHSTSLDLLRHHLEAKNLRQADEETRRLIIALAGEAAVKRGYVFFSEVQFIPAEELRAIDALWRQHSDGRFGYSVQRKIWKKSKKDFTNFFKKVGWMKKLEGSEVEQYNYRSFPTEFVWEMEEGPPEGHLPLTNALRGTQLLNCILTHPAFDGDEDEDQDEDENQNQERESDMKPLSKRGTAFQTNYSF